MSRSEYYHRQADLCVRMALSAGRYDERIRLLDTANGYRDMASRAEALDVTTPLNDRLRVMTDDSILDWVGIDIAARLRSASRHIAKDCGHRFGRHAHPGGSSKD